MSGLAPARSRVRRHYAAYRRLQMLPERCDNPECQFFTAPLLWNGAKLPLVLDHVSGNASDNRPENLRYLCPNCDSQNSHTRGGANAGRIRRHPTGSYEVRNRNGSQDAYIRGVTLSATAEVLPGTVTASVSYPADEHPSDA